MSAQPPRPAASADPVETAAPRAEAASFRLRHRAEDLAMRLPALLLEAEQVANTVAQGVHGRRKAGMGEAFWQFRRYQMGDSIAAIDWRQSAKSAHVFVRENEWEAAQSVWLWRDRSPSMDWSGDARRPTKRARAELIALALAILLLRAGERVALLGSGERPSASRTAGQKLAEALVGDRGSGDSLPGVEPLPRHAQVVLVSDFLTAPDRLQPVLQGFAARGLRGHLLQILDPAEETLPYDGRVEFEGLEAGEGRLTVPRVAALRQAYGERLAAHEAALEALARSSGWSFTRHRTDRPASALLLPVYRHLMAHKGG